MAENIPVSTGGVRPSEKVTAVRRLVTGVNESGKSVIVEDATSPHVHVIADHPDYVYTDLWRTQATPVDNSGPADDGLSAPGGIAPGSGGSVFRTVEFPPDTAWDTGADLRAAMYHSTPSLDYAIVLSGEIWAVLDDDETLMRAGDVLIQRGTAHAWSNRSDHQAIVAFVLIGGTAQP
jgi:hypothetical protein